MSTPTPATKTALIVGASRGLGLALTQEHLARGWRVIATSRSQSSALADVASAARERLHLERLEMTDRGQIAALRERLAGEQLDLLLVNAGITNGDQEFSAVSTDTFNEVMVTNALSPMLVVEALQDLVTPTGTIAVMSSTQGSLANNNRSHYSGYEVYRASKSALNQLMRSYAARHDTDERTLLLLCPGWVQTELGGPNAALTVEESIPALVDVIERHAGDGGLQFRNYRDEIVAW